MSKILVVEDDEFLVASYKAKLVQEGFELETATDGEEGLMKVSDFRPDLIILDLVMPKMDGLTFLKKIKSDDNMKDIPVIIASNVDQTDTVDEGLKLGANEYFVKSDISIDELSSICKKYLT